MKGRSCACSIRSAGTSVLGSVRRPVEGVEEHADAGFAYAAPEKEGDAEVLRAERRRDYVKVGQAELVAGDLERAVGILLDDAVYVSQGLASEILEHGKIGHQGDFLNFGLVHGCDLPVEGAERIQIQIAAEGVAVQQDVVQVAGCDQGLYPPAVVGEFGTDAAELLVGQFQHPGKAPQIAEILPGNFHSGLVAGVVVHIGPGMLEDGAELHLEAYVRALVTADVVQGQIAETVDFVQLALVDAVLPVDFEKPFDEGSHLVDVVDVEGYHPEPYDVRNVGKRRILRALQFEFAGERRLGFHPGFDGCHDYAGGGKHVFDFLARACCKLFKYGQFAAVFLKYGFGVGVQSGSHVLKS